MLPASRSDLISSHLHPLLQTLDSLLLEYERKSVKQRGELAYLIASQL
jgi:hypothetical protein